MNPFLARTDVVDFDDPAIAALGAQLRAAGEPSGYAARCFNWVKEEVAHSADVEKDVVTCGASEVLRERVGLCYAKSHLLVALLRAGGVPAGFGYQRLALDDAGKFCLHGLVAVNLPDGTWYRVDPRGGVRGAGARFEPPRFFPVYPADAWGEFELLGFRSEPLPEVVRALRAHRSLRDLMRGLPDWDGAASGTWRSSRGVTHDDPGLVRFEHLSGLPETYLVKRWHKRVGDSVSPGECVVTLETETMECDVEVWVSGRLAVIEFSEGASFPDGAVLCRIAVKKE